MDIVVQEPFFFEEIVVQEHFFFEKCFARSLFLKIVLQYHCFGKCYSVLSLSKIAKSFIASCYDGSLPYTN